MWFSWFHQKLRFKNYQEKMKFSSGVAKQEIKYDVFITDTRARRQWDLKKSLINVIFYGMALLFLASVLTTYSNGNDVEYQTNISTEKSMDVFTSTCVIPELKNKDQFYEYIDQVSFSCKKLITVGGSPYPNYSDHIDGDKKICLDPAYQFSKGNCTVLSFGISNDWSFEDAIDKSFSCKVHAFDPTIGLKSHSRSDNVKFYNIGLGDTDMVTPNARIRKFETLINRLRLQNIDIDYLKMDIEGSEIYFADDVFKNNIFLIYNIKQIIMEIHPAMNPPTKYLKHFWDALHQFDCYGFKIVGSYPNLIPVNLFTVDGHVRSIGYEILMVNTRYVQQK